MHDVGQDAGLREERATALGLLDALLREGHVDPAGEEVLGIPLALAVAEQHKGVGHGLHPAAGPPPDIELGSEFSQDTDPRYAGEPIPRAEALEQVLVRALPYWESEIVPDLKTGKTVLVAAHGNSIRALVKHLDDVDPGTIAGINIPTGIPLLYTLDEVTLKPTNPGGTYLDPDAAAEAIKAVANQGR